MGKAIWVGVLSVILGSACTGDGKVPEDAGSYEPGDVAGDGDGDSGDGDSGDGDSGDGDSGDGDVDGGNPGGDGDAPPGVPDDGTMLASCKADDDCGDGLSCYGNDGNVGYCAEMCANDRECTDIDGLLTLCNDGECAIDCGTGANGTDGECPDQMECNSAERCNYPSTSKGVDGMWADCSSNECGENLTCEGEGGGGPFPTSGGFCTTTCQNNSDCNDDGGKGGTAECASSGGGFPIGGGGSGYCIIACSSNAECPAGMVCEGGGFSDQVCQST